MDLPATIAWLVDEASASAGPDRFLAELGGRLVRDGLPLVAGSLTSATPHPIIARRTWMWKAETGAVIESLGFAGGARSDAERSWLVELGPVHANRIGSQHDSVLAWAGTRIFSAEDAAVLRQVARFAAAPL